MSKCPPIWIESPPVLWSHATDFFPFSEAAQRCTTTALNSLTRFGLYFGALLSLLCLNPYWLLASVGIAVLSVAIYYGMVQNKMVREGFQTIVGPTLVNSSRVPGERLSIPLIGGIDVADKTVSDVIGTPSRTGPTDANPFMNVLVNEVLDYPTKPPAMTVDTPEMARVLSDQFQTRMYGDPSDVFQHTQNQRTWVAQPSTSIPNDQDSFQNWLFRVPGPTFKEGNNAVGRTATEGGAVTWLSAN
jgi:hypothetical protein